MSDIAQLRSQVAYMVEESVKGVITYPTTSTPKILSVDLVQMDQEHPKTSSPEIIGDTRDIINLCNAISPAGSWSAQTLSRPVGAGVAPHEAALMTAAFGSETINAGVDVDYELLVDKKSYTLWRRSGHTVYFATGATCNTYTESLGDNCELRLTFEGQFMRMGWAGTSTITGVASDVITVEDPDRYTVGAKVELVDDGGNIEDNTGSGYIITDKTGNDITVSPTPPVATYITLQGFLPNGTEAGTALPARPATVTVGTYTAKVRTLSITFTDNVGYIEDEITGLGYPESFTAGQRDVSFSMSLYFRENDTDFHEWAKENTAKQIVVDMGAATGVNRKTTMLDCRFSNVSITNDDPSLGVQVEGMAKGSVTEDSISVKYL
jgi:hypothetical protein